MKAMEWYTELEKSYDEALRLAIELGYIKEVFYDENTPEKPEEEAPEDVIKKKNGKRKKKNGKRRNISTPLKNEPAEEPPEDHVWLDEDGYSIEENENKVRFHCSILHYHPHHRKILTEMILKGQEHRKEENGDTYLANRLANGTYRIIVNERDGKGGWTLTKAKCL